MTIFSGTIANASKTTIRPNYGKGITITFRIPDADQLTKINENLIQKQAHTTQIQKKWGAVLFHCFDPEGNRLEFWTDIPK
ncbi:VOC family protein [bacterium]|nr:VOC family protein [bacterium]